MNDCKCIGSLNLQKRFEKYEKLMMEIQLQCYVELENYLCYMMRCLLRAGKQWDNDEIALVTFEKNRGLSQAVVYPRTAIKEGQGIVNPLFFCGYYIAPDYDKEYKFNILITEDYQLLQTI